MIVSLIGNNKIYKVKLPENITGSYWINNEKEKLINIKAIDEKWQIVSDTNIKISIPKIANDSQNFNNEEFNGEIDRIILQEYSNYYIYIKSLQESFILCCFPSCENKWYKLEIGNKSSILIGKNKDNDIIINNNLISDLHTRLLLYNGRWIIENYDLQFGTFINDRPVINNESILRNGDIIFIMGIKIVIIGKKLFINNPLNQVHCGKKIYQNTKNNINDLTINDSNINVEYPKKYFSRAPILVNKIETAHVEIDSPPNAQEQEKMPLVLSIGSSLTMGVITLITIITAIDNRISGNSTTKQMIFSLITAAVMLLGMIGIPILSQRYMRKKNRIKEEKRNSRYREYLAKKQSELEEITEEQKKILFYNYASAEECTKIVLERTPRLWERKITDDDFINLRIGIGDVPLDAEIIYQKEKFEVEDNLLIKEMNQMVDNFKMIKSVPTVVSLSKDNILAIINNTNKKVNRFLHSLILQLITFHNYADLKLVFLVNRETTKSWEHIKMLPHIWNEDRTIRFFTDDYSDMEKISQYLVKEFNERIRNGENDFKSFAPYYLIITDDYKKIENLQIIKEVLKMNCNVGFSLLCMTNDILELPEQCTTFINLQNDKIGTIFGKENSLSNQRKIIFDDSVVIFFDRIVQNISNISIKSTNGKSGQGLPNNYTFLDMYDVSKIEDLDILDRWEKNNSSLSLKAPIGIDESGTEIALDIHEKFHGPHGLIAGSTGSGKSEFIITYILSMAINYHPDDVKFVLIDYKGGGLAGAFQKRDIKLPHLVGTITNIDTNGLQRSLVSIQSELRRRQIMFNKARDMTDEGTIDIYKYQRLYHEGLVKTPISHLLIICDEFAELKQQQPDFMAELISVSRIGRSLGVHLILATQKPAGVVDEQIRSNSKFAICLKVQDRSDSTDVIKRPDAANIKKAGQFYMLVGNDEYYVLGQSGWSGAKYIPSTTNTKEIDNSIEFISNIGETLKRAVFLNNEVKVSKGEQLTNILIELSKIASKKNIYESSLWLENIPETIYLENVKEKYNIIREKGNVEAVIGEYDDPYNQKQDIVKIGLLNKGNVVIYGNAESGKETLLSTTIYDLITSYTPEDVQIYIMDFGTEALKIYNEAPHVGDIAFVNDVEKIINFFKMMQREINIRKKELIEYNGDYKQYLQYSNKTMPIKLIIINSFETLTEVSQNRFDDIMITLTREGIKCGIVFMITLSHANDLRYRLSQNFQQKIVLQMNSDDEYISIFERLGRKKPAHLFGRGLIDIEQNQICEFQTAKIGEARQYNSVVQKAIKELKEKYPIGAEAIPVLPEVVTIDIVKDNLKDLTCIPIGMTKKEIKVYEYDFVKNFITRIMSNNWENMAQWITKLSEEISMIKDVNMCILGFENKSDIIAIEIKNKFDQFINNLKNSKNNICLIVGIDKFVSDYKAIGGDFNKEISESEKCKNVCFIFADITNKYKNQEYEEWYKKFITKENGIWIGDGFDSQYAISTTTDRSDIIARCGKCFGYAVKDGKASLIKLIEMRENKEENG